MLEGKLLEYDDVKIEYYDFVDLEIKMCIGCCVCYKNGKCHINDDAEMISDKISTADGLIIGSPTYASNVSGMLKVFIDRGHFVIEQLLYGKYAISVATGENYGSNDTKNRRKYPIQSIIHSIIFNIGIKSFVKCKGENYQGVLDKWKEKDIHVIK